MDFGKRLVVLSVISFSSVGCDQYTKTLAKEYLPRDGMDSYLFDMVRIGYAENTGAFLSLGEDLPEEFRFWLFTVAIGVVLLGFFAYLLVNSKTSFLEYCGSSLFLAGGVSNLYDRATNNGVVIDFLNIGVGSLRTGIFNIADVALMIGLGLILLSSLKPLATETMTTNK